VFVHLHVHSPFSFLDGTSPIDELVQRAAELDMPALAITDHNNLSGAVRFHKACHQAGIKPIIGAEVTVEEGHHLTVLAKNRAGYANLCRLLTEAHLSNERGKPVVNEQVLRKYPQDIIALSGCWHSEVFSLAYERRYAQAEKAIGKYRDIFEPGNFYIELQETLYPRQHATNKGLYDLAQKLGLPVVATGNVHYTDKSQFKIQDTLTCVRTLTTMDKPHPERKINAEFYFKLPQQMEDLFAWTPQALDNTMQIAERCQPYELASNKYLPHFDIEGQSAIQLLRQLTYKGARHRYNRLTTTIKKRLEYELGIIEQLGFADYFLVVWDVAREARKRGIRYAGRGSAADSAVAYCLYVTDVDTVARNLSFERFINPERGDNLPDIDIDFDARYRDDIAEYVTQKYGEDKVATVCTFQTYHARGAIRDIAKALGFPSEEIDRLAKLMPHISAENIDQAFEKFPELRDSQLPLYRYQQLFELCSQAAGLPRHIGTHLGGVIISGTPLDTLSPIQQAAKGCRIIQFDKVDVEDLGLLKLDLLSLRTLSAVQDTITCIPKQLDFASIPLDDQPTYKLLNSGETAGAFQLESPAQRNLQSRLQADNIEDVVVSVALIRPGPIKGNMVEPFLARRHGQEPITYVDPRLEEILKDTYGVVLFQEQVIEIAVKIAGFSPGEADQLRRALTHHRDSAKMQTIGNTFIRKAMKQGSSEQVAETIFSYIEGYAGYGFCEAHAAAFGDTSYKTAYLLTHYPAHFYAALLSNQPMGYFPAHTLINEAKRRGIRVLGPDVKCSQTNFIVQDGAIRVGLNQIKQMPQGLAKRIVAQQPYNDLPDFMRRARPAIDVARNLALCGAFDCFDNNRRRILWQLGAYQPARQPQLNLQQTTELQNIADFTDQEKCYQEWEILGFSPAWHPLEFVRPQLTHDGTLTNHQIKEQRPEGTIKAAGLLIRPHRPPTRSGRTVVFFTLEDETGLLDVTVFHNIYEKHGRQIFSSSALLVEGHLDGRGTPAIIAEQIASLS